VALSVVAFQSAYFWASVATSQIGDDPFDSPLYWWSWLITPVLGMTLGLIFPLVRCRVWMWVIVVPTMLGVALVGTVFHDPDEGASLWVVGEVFVVVQALIVSAAVGIGRWIAGRRSDLAV
jgi:hypothetical protein